MKRHRSPSSRRGSAEFRLHFEVLEPRMMLATLDPMSQPRFVNPLPIPAVMQPTTPGGTEYTVSISQFEQNLGLVDPQTGQPMLTTVWGYNGSYPGPTFDVSRNTPITVRWENNLVDEEGMPLPHLLPVDENIHWAAPEGWPDSGVPVVTHLHGGHTDSASDGLPEAWFTPEFAQVGPDWSQEDYTYENDQRAATLWYHDHTLGITRLNVQAGLAGFYLVRDTWEASLNLPKGRYEIPLVIQDRMFDEDGQLFIPSEMDGMDGMDGMDHSGMSGMDHSGMTMNTGMDSGGEMDHETGFFGDFILVNGKTWPALDVEPRKYRFRLLNGSDSRFYTLSFAAQSRNGQLTTARPFQQIGGDQGLLTAPQRLQEITIAPGERADIVVDFSGLRGRTLILKNTAVAPAPSGERPDVATTGQIMAFRVNQPLSGRDRSTVPHRLLPPGADTFGRPVRTRQLLLAMGPGEHDMTNGEMPDDMQDDKMAHFLGTVADGRLAWDDPVTENPAVNDVEVWEFYNTTPDSHPIHLHDASFRVLNRQRFTATEDPMTGALSNIQFVGRARSFQPVDAVKDTVVVPPGEVVRVVAKFGHAGEFVWHCHMLSHEDNQMMRPLVVGPSATPVNVSPPAAIVSPFLPASASHMMRSVSNTIQTVMSSHHVASTPVVNVPARDVALASLYTSPSPVRQPSSLGPLTDDMIYGPLRLESALDQIALPVTMAQRLGHH